MSMTYSQKVSNDIGNIDKNIENLKSVTKDWIKALEERKQQILKSSSKESDVQPTAAEIECVLQELDRYSEMVRIQNEHDIALLQMLQTQNALKERLSSLEKLEALINALTFKICETNEEFRQEMEETMRLKDLILRTDSTDQAVALADLEKRIADCRNMHESNIATLEGQKNEIQNEVTLKMSEMESDFDSSMKLYKALHSGFEMQKMGALSSYKEGQDKRPELQKQGKDALDSKKRLRGTHGGTSTGSLQGDSQILEQSLKVPTGTPTILKTESFTSSLSGSSLDLTHNGGITTEDAQFLKSTLGKPLALAMAEITAKQPRDPIHYLGHWLLKYRYNQEIDVFKREEIKYLIEERVRIENKKLHVMFEEEARNILGKLAVRAEKEAIKKELQRIAKQENDEFEA